LGGGFSERIFHTICSSENLFAAWNEFRKGKNKKPDVLVFALRVENNIFELQRELRESRWKGDGYTSFSIRDPKPRSIHEASVRDRVLHQAVYRVLYLLFDQSFIHDSYSSRMGKGTHIAIRRLENILRKESKNYRKPIYVLKCDIRKFFDSIDRIILMRLIEKKIDCPETLNLIRKILDTFHKTPGRGLPLGNVTSQLFANVYMNEFDQCMKRELGITYYLRYCDDFVIVSDSRTELAALISVLNNRLKSTLKLEMHPNKVCIRSLKQGVDFLGAVILPYRVITRTKTKHRICKKLRKIDADPEKARQIVASYLGHISHHKASFLRRNLYNVLSKQKPKR